LIIPQNAHALGKIGHRVTGLIASNHLTPEAQQQVAVLLQGESLAEVANWPDHMRSNPHHFWQKLSASWHYVSIPDNRSYAKSNINPKGDVYQAINAFKLILADKKLPDGAIKQGLVNYFGDLNQPSKQLEIKRFALKFLMHLVGDIHQPLHVGYKKDAGGNRTEVEWFNNKTNLHRVWDTDLINYQELSFTEMTAFIDITDKKQIENIQNSTLDDWIVEDKQLRKGVYKIGNGKLGYAYIYTNGPIIEQQLLKAGLRMAKILNDIFQ
jgi:hypothetical protein